MKRKNSIAVPILLIVIGILFIVGGLLIPLISENDKEVRSDLYVVPGTVEGTYGIARSDGTMLAQAMYTKIAMGDNIIYLKDTKASYLYNLENNTQAKLDGNETDIIFPKDKEGTYIGKYILKYGADESSAVYRVVDSKGEKVLDKDYASISEVYVAIGANLVDSAKGVEKSVLGADKTLVKALNYLTEDGKYQYIVKNNATQNTMYGIVDETGKIIVPLEYTIIETQEGKNSAVTAKKNNKLYVIPASGTPIEIATDFEADITGEGYIIQKRGSTANKLYNLKGEVVIDQIFDYPITAVTLNSKTTSYLLIENGTTGKWKMYDLEDTQKSVKEYSNINTEYLKDKKLGETSTSFIYVKNSANYVVDLETFSEYKLKIATPITAPLEPGYKVGNVEEQQ